VSLKSWANVVALEGALAFVLAANAGDAVVDADVGRSVAGTWVCFQHRKPSFFFVTEAPGN
jgi:hypothetical protein